MTNGLRGTSKSSGRHPKVTPSCPGENSSPETRHKVSKDSTICPKPVAPSPGANGSRGGGLTQPRRSLGGLSLNGLAHPHLIEGISKNVGNAYIISSEIDGEWNKENIPPIRFGLRLPDHRRSIVRHPSLSAPPRFRSSVKPPRLLRDDSSESDGDEETKICSKFVRTITSFERDGKVILRFGKLTPASSNFKSSVRRSRIAATKKVDS
ncbi:hypothetical protein BKA70DRAFT_1569260 [Coprinopsis sp. MPI-PUGE-AT-0042]|nr:hypothetical protein BKA70DRAFT_1569260 [Coprinopsis sp. MPI-PUGE-AT-0042]